MPFKSKKQQKWMFIHHPEMAKEWAEETKDFSKLPEKVKKQKKSKKKKASELIDSILVFANYYYNLVIK